MSFLSGILDVGKSVVGFLGGNSIWSGLAKTAIMGYALNRLNSNTNKGSDAGKTANIDGGVRVTTPNASTAHFIPVLYGTAWFPGKIFDVRMSADNKTMFYAIALAEKSGPTIAGTQPSYTFKDVYWENQRVEFKADGITVNLTRDRVGNEDRSLDGLVKIYFYAGNSTSGIIPENYTGSVPPAYSIFPNWAVGTHTLDNLIFAIVRVDYNREKNVTGLANDLKWQVANSIKYPGDVLYDYMTNTRYGASIPSADIDTTSLVSLNTYAQETVTYTYRALNGTVTPGQTLDDRYQINGLINTEQPILENIEKIGNASATWLSYDNYDGKWGVIVNRAGTSVSSFNDTNILGTVSVSGTGLRETYNEAKVEFPDRELRDGANFVKITLDPLLRNANEIPKSLELSYDIINDPVQAKLLGFIELKQSRVDKVIQFQTDFSKINLKPGDIIDVTNSRLSFNAKLFRIISISEVQDDGALMCDITALEYDSTVYSTADMDKYEVSNNDEIETLGSIGAPGTPQITKVEVDSRPRIVIESNSPNFGIVEVMEFWLTTDTTVPDDNQRNYRLIGTVRPAVGTTFGSGTAVRFEYDAFGGGNFLVKTRGANGFVAGPYSATSGSVFTPTQTTQAIDPNTKMFDSTGGLLTGLALVSLAQKLLDLFGSNSGKSIFERVFDVFKDTTGVDLVGQASGGSLVVASQIAIKNNGGTITSTVSSIDYQGPFSVTASGSDVIFKLQNGTKKGQQLFWDGGEWRIADGCCEPIFTKAPEPETPEEPCVLNITETLPASNQTLNATGCGNFTPLVPNTGSYFVKFGNNKGYGLYGKLEKGSGSIKLYLTNGTLVETVSVAACRIHTDWLEIPFTKAREVSTDYYITMDEGCVIYCACPNKKLDSGSGWAFTTAPYAVKPYNEQQITQSQIQTYTPQPFVRLRATSFSPNTTQYAAGSCRNKAELRIVWSEKVIKGTGNIEIVDVESGAVVGTRAVSAATLEPVSSGNATARASITDGKVTGVEILTGGGNYTGTVTAIFSKPATGEKAEGTVSLSNGSVSSVSITYAGWGYTSAPTITFQGTQEVSEANADRAFNWGSISSLNLQPGKRYAVRVPTGAAIASRNPCPVENAQNEAFSYSFLIDEDFRLVRYILCSDPYTDDSNYQKVNIRSNIRLIFNRPFKIKETGPANAIIYATGLFGGIHQTIDLRSTYIANKTGRLSNFNETLGTDDKAKQADDTISSPTATFLALNPTKPFKPGTTYYIQIPAGVIIDAACEVDWAGISDSTTVTWKTDVIDNTTPAAPPAGTPAKRTIEYELGRPAVPGTGKVNILDSSGNLVAQIDSTDPAVTYQYG